MKIIFDHYTRKLVIDLEGDIITSSNNFSISCSQTSNNALEYMNMKVEVINATINPTHNQFLPVRFERMEMK